MRPARGWKLRAFKRERWIIAKIETTAKTAAARILRKLARQDIDLADVRRVVEKIGSEPSARLPPTGQGQVRITSLLAWKRVAELPDLS